LQPVTQLEKAVPPFTPVSFQKLTLISWSSAFLIIDQMADKIRWYICIYLDSLHTAKSGEVFAKEGEWYFNTNGNRFPHKGHIKLGKNETFTPTEPKPTLWSSICNGSKDPLIVDFKVKEEDVIHDDLMLEGKVHVPWETMDKIFELISKDSAVHMKVRIKVEQQMTW